MNRPSLLSNCALPGELGLLQVSLTINDDCRVAFCPGDMHAVMQVAGERRSNIVSARLPIRFPYLDMSHAFAVSRSLVSATLTVQRMGVDMADL
jgi:hypothetical protein